MLGRVGLYMLLASLMTAPPIAAARGFRTYWSGWVETEQPRDVEPFGVFDTDEEGRERPVPLPPNYPWACVVRTTWNGPATYAGRKQKCESRSDADARKGCLAILRSLGPNQYDKEIRCAIGGGTVRTSVTCSDRPEGKEDSEALRLEAGTSADPITIYLMCRTEGPY